MIKLRCFILVVFITTTSGLNAQDFDFGKVSKSELQEEYSPSDSTAVAEYLHKYRKTYFQYVSGVGFRLVTDVHDRIKIYTKDGFDFATKKIMLYKDGNTKEDMSRLKAKTYNLVGTKIEETPLKKDGQFKVEISEYRDQKSFTMPNIKEGSVIEYRYQINSPYISNIDEFIFQHEIPVRELEAILESPEYFVFRLNMKGFLRVMPKKERFNKNLNFSQRVASGGGNGTGAGQGLGRTKLQQENIKYFSDVTTYKMNNVPALKEEPYVNELNNYRSGVKYELSYTQFPNSPRKLYTSSWEDVIKTIYKNSSFGEELNKTSYFKSDLEQLLVGVADSHEKMLKILAFLKSKVKWNEVYGKYTRDGVKKAYQNGKGNVAEINLMLTAMLSYAGLDASPVLVSTRANGIPLFPTREGYNYVVSSVKFDEGILLLDATSVNSLPGVLPFRALNWEGRIIKKDGSSTTIGLYPETKSTTRIFLNADLTQNGVIEGKVREAYTNHKALSFRNSYDANNQETYIRDLEEDNGGIEISNFEVKNENNLSKSAIASYDYVMENDIDVIADKIYFAPLLFLTTKENPFKLENREFPIDFRYPSKVNTVATIKIPEGFKVEFSPEPVNMALPEGMGSFKYNVMKTINTLQLKVTIDINQAVIPAPNYLSLKEYYKKMIEKMNEKVVLSKI